jgi:hypothetical protein
MVRTAEGVMAHLAEHGSQPWVKELAKKLQPLMGKTGIERVEAAELNEGVPKAARGGWYRIRDDAIRVTRPTESDILHEAVHAATERGCRRPSRSRARQPAGGALKKAYDDLTGCLQRGPEDAGLEG